MAEPENILRQKVPVLSELRTRQWDAVPVWIRERAFWMSSVVQAEVLDTFRQVTDRATRGELSPGEAREAITERLESLGYTPEPGQAGTIKDLRSLARQNVAYQTNQSQVRNWALWQRQQATLGAFPAKRLVRMRQSKKQRDWDARWAEALAKTGMADGAARSEHVALVNHPIWSRLSRFGTPYPPFDFNSGMGVEPVDREEAEALGLLDGEVEEMMQPQDRGMNDGLEASPRIDTQEVRDALAKQLGGLARWEGKVLKFTDPNGTAPRKQADLASAWKTLPKGIEPLQKNALIEWAGDHDRFHRANATDKWADLGRLHARLVNQGDPVPLYRGMSMSNEQLDEFLAGLDAAGGYAPRGNYPVESWTSSESAAARYARTGGGGWSVIIESRQPDPAAWKDVSELVRTFAPAISKQSRPPVQTEAEWMLSVERKFRHRVKKDQASRTVRIVLGEEVP